MVDGRRAELDGLSDERDRGGRRQARSAAWTARPDPLLNYHRPARPGRADRPRDPREAASTLARRPRRRRRTPSCSSRIAAARRAGRPCSATRTTPRTSVADQTAQDDRGGRARCSASSPARPCANAREEAEALARAGRVPDRAVGLVVLRGEGAQGPLRLRRRRTAALLRARRRAAATACSTPPTRLYGMTFTERPRPVRLPPGRAGLRGVRRGRLAARPVPARPLRPAHQAGRRVDEQPASTSRACSASSPVVMNNLNITKPARGADAADLRRGQHRVPRVRPRAARPVLRRALPALLRHHRAARLRRVPLAGQRDVGDLAGGPGQLRQAPRDRRADAAGAAGQDEGRREVQPGLRDRRVPGRGAARLGLAHSCGAGEAGRRTPRRSRRRRWSAPASPSGWCRRATAPTTSRTSSRAATAPATTPTSGARCSTPTPSSGSRRTAGCKRENGDNFRRALLSRGGSVDAMTAFRDFRGRDPQIEPLLERRGLL